MWTMQTTCGSSHGSLRPAGCSPSSPASSQIAVARARLARSGRPDPA
jgi:hypothetical protein